MAEALEFLGVGWKFPVRVNPRGGLSYSSGEQKIEEAIWIILGTRTNSRQMRPRFGCGIQDFVFSAPSEWAGLAQWVRDALSEWEPRIDVLDVRVDSELEEANKVLIRIDYRVRANNAQHNMVYPFFITEGAGA